MSAEPLPTPTGDNPFTDTPSETAGAILVRVLGPDEPIEMEELRAHAACAECGAVVTFEGVVRLTEDGHALDAIEYEHHEEMASLELEKLARQAFRRFGVRRVACVHRVGTVPVQEASVVVIVGADHRGPAFAACESLIAELKKVVPIWKSPVFRGSAKTSEIP